MPGEKLPSSELDVTLRRLELCAYAVHEIHAELLFPNDPEDKADLILSTEKLLAETIELYQTVKLAVWGPDPEELEYFED
jgi:hypothetical protein